MSKNSHKSLYEQLKQWLPTLKSKKTVKNNRNGKR